MSSFKPFSTKLLISFFALALLTGAGEVLASPNTHHKHHRHHQHHKHHAPGHLHPVVAKDYNPDPHIVEVTLVAFPRTIDFGTGNRTSVWTYNGSIPGPTIQGHVGDTLIVHLYNYLPIDTTIHWHGLELPANMDGNNIGRC